MLELYYQNDDSDHDSPNDSANNNDNSNSNKTENATYNTRTHNIPFVFYWYLEDSNELDPQSWPGSLGAGLAEEKQKETTRAGL